MTNLYELCIRLPVLILFFLTTLFFADAQEYNQIEKEKISFFSRYLNLTNAQKQVFLDAVSALDQNLSEINRLEKEDPQEYLLKLRSLNNMFEVEVKQLLAIDQHGRWKDFQNREERAVYQCKRKAKVNGWTPHERLKEEIKIRYRYTTLNL
jgi:hypothetical protein